MKRIFSMLCAVAICLGMAGCGANGVEKHAYDAAKQAIEAADDYLDFEISKNELEERLNRLIDRLYEVNFDNVKDEKKRGEMAYDVGFVQVNLSSIMYKSDKDTEILKERNDLAEFIGEPIR